MNGSATADHSGLKYSVSRRITVRICAYIIGLMKGVVTVVTVRCLAQGHLDTQLGGAGDRTSNLPVNSQPTLPPESHATFTSSR